MIALEKEYRKFLAARGLQGNTIDTYVSKLNGVSKKVGKPISSELFGGAFSSEDGFEDAWGEIKRRIETVAGAKSYAPRTLDDCKSNLKRYWEMLRQNEELR